MYGIEQGCTEVYRDVGECMGLFGIYGDGQRCLGIVNGCMGLYRRYWTVWYL